MQKLTASMANRHMRRTAGAAGSGTGGDGLRADTPELSSKMIWLCVFFIVRKVWKGQNNYGELSR